MEMQPSGAKPISKPAAEEIAVRFLGYLATQPEQLTRFKELTGTDLDALRQRARDTDFLAALLDYLMSDEALLLAFTANDGIAPDLIYPARLALGSRE